MTDLLKQISPQIDAIRFFQELSALEEKDDVLRKAYDDHARQLMESVILQIERELAT